METRELSVEERNVVGSAEVNRMRKTGVIPAIVYSGGEAATKLSVNCHQFVQTVKGAKPTQIYKFVSPSANLNSTMVLIKSVQSEPLKGVPLHVDFVSIKEGQTVVVSVPLEVYGECDAVKENRAYLYQTVYEIEVECLPTSIPASVKINISGLKEGGSLHASNAELPAGVKLVSLAKMTVVTAMSKKAMDEDPALKAQEAATAATAATAAAASAAAAAPAAAGAKAPAKAAAKAPEKKGK